MDRNLPTPKIPRYADGGEARCGDVVRGQTYNCAHEVIGVVVSVTPGVESCELQVAYTTKADTTFMVGSPKPIVVIQKSDYADARAFRKVA
jgi:hypothetical protein